MALIGIRQTNQVFFLHAGLKERWYLTNSVSKLSIFFIAHYLYFSVEVSNIDESLKTFTFLVHFKLRK